jgi:hypothetical protein
MTVTPKGHRSGFTRAGRREYDEAQERGEVAAYEDHDRAPLGGTKARPADHASPSSGRHQHAPTGITGREAGRS